MKGYHDLMTCCIIFFKSTNIYRDYRCLKAMAFKVCMASYLMLCNQGMNVLGNLITMKGCHML